VSHSSSSFSESSLAFQATIAVPDVHVSSVVLSGDGTMRMGIDGSFTVNLVLSVVVPMVEDGNPRVFPDSISVVPSGQVGASLA